MSKAGKLNEAITILQQAIRIQPDQSVAHFNLGVAYHKMGDTNAAEAAYQRALMLDPEDTDIQSNLALLARNRKRSAAEPAGSNDS
jgi:Flp pilus assembly protein TadD